MHICDSIKRRLKADGDGAGLQGEFGIGLLSFWTVGETLTMVSTGADKRAYLRYLVRLYVKELVLRNFAGVPAEQLLGDTGGSCVPSTREAAVIAR
jgi:hypothetical protein